MLKDTKRFYVPANGDLYITFDGTNFGTISATDLAANYDEVTA